MPSERSISLILKDPEFFIHKNFGELALGLVSPVNTDKVLSERDKTRQLGVYVHVPFCTEICSFCAFHREVPKPGRQENYIDALQNHSDTILSSLDGMQNVDSVYFGGGTPSLLSPDDVFRIFQTIGEHVDANEATVSFEIHPENISRSYIKALTAVGIDRFSVGVQNLSGEERQSLHRDLTSEDEDVESLKIMKSLGVPFNVDLMFGTPTQKMDSWILTLDRLTGEVGPDEITLYQYVNAYGSETRKKIVDGELSMPGVSERHTMYRVARSMLLDDGYVQTSTLSFSKKDGKRKLLNRGRDFIGLGPRTYSKVGRHFFINDATTSDFVSGRVAERFYGFSMPSWLNGLSEKSAAVSGSGKISDSLDPWKSEVITQAYGVLYYVLNQPRISNRIRETDQI